MIQNENKLQPQLLRTSISLPSLPRINNHSRKPGVVSGRVGKCIGPKANSLGLNPSSAIFFFLPVWPLCSGGACRGLSEPVQAEHSVAAGT